MMQIQTDNPSKRGSKSRSRDVRTAISPKLVTRDESIYNLLDGLGFDQGRLVRDSARQNARATGRSRFHFEAARQTHRRTVWKRETRMAIAGQPHRRPSGTPDEQPRGESVRKARRIVRTEVSFIYNADFDRLPASELLSSPLVEKESPAELPQARSLTRELILTLYEVPLLSFEDEQSLFRRMNFLKFRANSRRSKLDPELPDTGLIEAVELDLRLSEETRNHILRANLRLVISIARRLTREQGRFDDAVSDGFVALMQAVDRFDYSRGFRFSTYATHAIQRDYFNRTKRQRVKDERVQICDPVVLHSDRISETLDQHWERCSAVSDSIQDAIATHLDRREQFVILQRFGLIDGKAHTLRELGELLSVSKERVRQLETRALRKLQAVCCQLMGDEIS